nr:hypothetical protein CFP56_49074 [Quercus suber]
MINPQTGSQVRDPTPVQPKHKSHPFVLRFVTQMQLPRPSILPISFSRIMGFRVFDMDSWFNARIFGWFFQIWVCGLLDWGGYGDFGGGLSRSIAFGSHGSLS